MEGNIEMAKENYEDLNDEIEEIEETNELVQFVPTKKVIKSQSGNLGILTQQGGNKLVITKPNQNLKK